MTRMRGDKKYSHCFADIISLTAGRNSEMQDLTYILKDSMKIFGMKNSTDKSKVRVNTNGNSKAEIYMGNVFKYLGVQHSRRSMAWDIKFQH